MKYRKNIFLIVIIAILVILIIKFVIPYSLVALKIKADERKENFVSYYINMDGIDKIVINNRNEIKTINNSNSDFSEIKKIIDGKMVKKTDEFFDWYDDLYLEFYKSSDLVFTLYPGSSCLKYGNRNDSVIVDISIYDLEKIKSICDKEYGSVPS